jgi:hypothetical protein
MSWYHDPNHTPLKGRAQPVTVTRIGYYSTPVANASPRPKLWDAQGFCPVKQVWQVEVDHVVADNHIWVRFQHQVTPAQQQLALTLKRHHLCEQHADASG